MRSGEELALFSPGGSVLLLAREGNRRGFFVGSVATLSVAEIFGFICSAIRSGTLVLQTGPVRRTVQFREGQISQATSTEPAERLGPVLWRNGLLKLEQLEEAEPLVEPGRRLGKVLSEKGWLTPADLYKGMQMQVREIVLAVFCLQEGEFAFVEQEPGEPSGLKLPERTRDLVLAGIKRSEELDALRRRLPAGAVPRRPGLVDVDALDGAHTVDELLEGTRLGLYEGLRALDELVSSGRVALENAAEVRARLASSPRVPVSRRLPGTEGLSPLELYRASVRHVCEVLENEGEPSDRLNTFFRSAPPGFEELFAGVTVREGELDVNRVLANAQKQHKGAMGRAMALEALDVFVSFALFDAANILPEDVAKDLARTVTQTLLGR
ncbi:MAG: DUF4388 domain-containing protein [Myxococcales bacterium]